VKRLNSIFKVIDTISVKLGTYASVLVPILMFTITYDVIGRRVFNRPSAWAYDVTYLMDAILILCILGWSMHEGGHIAIDVITVKLSKRQFMKLQAFAYPIMGIPFFLVVIVKSFTTALLNTQIGELTLTSRIPLWPIRWIIGIGFTWFFVQYLVEWVRILIEIRTGKKLEALAAEESDKGKGLEQLAERRAV